MHHRRRIPGARNAAGSHPSTWTMDVETWNASWSGATCSTSTTPFSPSATSYAWRTRCSSCRDLWCVSVANDHALDSASVVTMPSPSNTLPRRGVITVRDRIGVRSASSPPQVHPGDTTAAGSRSWPCSIRSPLASHRGSTDLQNAAGTFATRTEFPVVLFGRVWVDLDDILEGPPAERSRITMNKLMMPLMLLAGGFLVLAIWRNPAVAAQDVASLLGTIGSFLQDVLAKVAEFLGSFGS